MKRSAFDLLVMGSKAQKRKQEQEERGSCPICGSSMAIKWMSDHVDKCLARIDSDAPSLETKAQAEPETLYKITRLPVKGLYIIYDFLSEEEEAELVNFLDSSDNPSACPPWKPSKFNGQCLSKAWGVKTEHGTSLV